MTLKSAAELIVQYIDGNRRARASYPDADLPIEEAMRLLGAIFVLIETEDIDDSVHAFYVPE